MPNALKKRNQSDGTLIRTNTQDITEVQQVLSSLGFLSIRASGVEAPFQMEVCRTGMKRAGIFQIRTTSSVKITSNLQRYCICFCPEGSFVLDSAGRKTKVGERVAVIVPPTDKLAWLLPAKARIAGIVLSSDARRCTDSDFPDEEETFRLEHARRFDISTNPGAVFADVLRMLTSDIDNSRIFSEHHAVCEMLEQLMTISLADIMGTDVRGGKAVTSIVPRHVKRAEDFIRQHLTESFDNGHLAKVAGVSSRSLYRGFLQFRGVSPARYVIDLRLTKARLLLEDDDAPKDIKEIAASAGFSSYASFWRSYVNKFGKTPSKGRPIKRNGAGAGSDTGVQAATSDGMPPSYDPLVTSEPLG